jgi:hypothetical protein
MEKLSYLQRLIKKQQEEYHKRKYVNHRTEAQKIKVKHKEFEDTLKDIISRGYKQIKPTTIRKDIPDHCFSCCCRNNKILSLMVYETNKDIKNYITNLKDSKNVENKNPMPIIKSEFLARTGKRFKDVFGTTAQDFKVCVPQPLYYKSQLYPNFVKIKNVSVEDFSSHYPSAAVGLLPNANTAKTVNAYVKPDAEYQFAFYPETGHIAVYNEFDTHNYIKNQRLFGALETNERRFKTAYLKHETYTVLMKAADERITELQTHYDIKNTYNKDTDEYNTAKLVLNKFIGMFEMNYESGYKSAPYAHLAAVIKWRANIKMFNLINTIGVQNVIQVIVDGIIHKGSAVGVKEKQLGNLITEAENATLIQRGISQYIVFGDKVIKKHQGLDLNLESDNIKDWQSSPKVKFLEYVKSIIEIKELD